MADRDEIQPGQQNQDDELDVEELEQAAGGLGGLNNELSPSEGTNGSGCNENCSC